MEFIVNRKTAGLRVTNKGTFNIFELSIETKFGDIKNIDLNRTVNGKVPDNIVYELEYLLEQIKEHNESIDNK